MSSYDLLKGPSFSLQSLVVPASGRYAVMLCLSILLTVLALDLQLSPPTDYQMIKHKNQNKLLLFLSFPSGVPPTEWTEVEKSRAPSTLRGRDGENWGADGAEDSASVLAKKAAFGGAAVHD